jgi:hypothetical protein
MSPDSRPYLTSNDVAMLERILAQANLPRSADTAKAEARSNAARMLIARFQRGETSEARLRDSLSVSGSGVSADSDDESAETADYPAEAADYDIAISISAIDTTTILPGIQYGYVRRAETERAWALYRDARRAPASVGARDLVALDAKTGVRAHRILNRPALD